jgi:predicted O-methyltransferase YrrM
MRILPEIIDNYISNHTEKEPKLLQELNKETWQKILNPRMLSGAYQGRVLSLLSKLIRPKNILEIGTYTGYSALCLAEGLIKDGELFTIDKNEELENFTKKYFQKSSYKNNIKQIIGNAVEVIPTLNNTFDLVFIDADKTNYATYFDLVINKMNSGGIIISDNVLWSGKVVEELNPKDKDTKSIIAYNKKIAVDNRVETVMLPIRDGLTICRVK